MAVQNQTIPFIAEVTMAAPDIIRVEVRDPVVTKYAPVGPLGTADTGAYATEVFPRANAAEGGANWAVHVISLTKKWLKFLDKKPTQFLDRANARIGSNWGTIGGKTVNTIYYTAKPYDEFFSSPTGSGHALGTTSRHYIYLHLSGNLAQGSYTISNATAGLAGVSFVWNDLTTRCCSIRAGQTGVRPADTAKQAYLSIWIPGHANEGAIDFLNDYTGLGTFHVIDATNSVVATGTVTQRTTPTTTELNQSTVQTVSTSVAPKLAASVATGNPTTITTTAAHGFSSGQIKHFRGFALSGGGLPTGINIEHQNAVITVTGATTFTVPINTTGQTWASGSYLSGYDGLVLDTVSRNRTQAYVFDLDFSAYTGAPAGTYRLQIPGLGVSDPFLIHDGAHSRVAQNACGGFYNQCNGLALDGRFGYTRSAPFVDGVNGVTIKWSMLPAPFGSELDGGPVFAANGGIPITTGVNAGEWLTSTRATGLYGSFLDAADWDTFPLAHGLSCYHLLDFCYEKLGTATRATSFGFPKSSATLDPTLYAGSDFLPDAIHQALWVADFYRRTQDTSGTSGLDGRVASGMGYDTGIGVFPAGDGGGGGGGPGTFEPSTLSIDQPFLYAADEASNFTAAGLFAKVAIIFKAEAATATGLGQTQRAIDMNRISSTYQTAAVAAYNWAAPIYADTGTGGARDAYYKTVLGLDVRASWSAPTYASQMTRIIALADANGTGGARAFAAGALYRLTLSSTYRTIIESYINQSGVVTDEGVWEYCYAFSFGGGDATYNTNQASRLGSSGFQIGATNDYVNYQEPATGPKPPYRILTFQANDTRTTIDRGVPVLLRAYISNITSGGSTTARAAFLRCLQAGQAYYYGANPLGLSFSVGIGARYPNDVCHRDSQAFGRTPPAGITVYGAGPNNTQGGGSNFANFSIDNDSNYTAEYPATSLVKMVEPYRFATPVYETYFENSFIIGANEFTTEETIIPRQLLAMWLHGYDNNTTT